MRILNNCRMGPITRGRTHATRGWQFQPCPQQTLGKEEGPQMNLSLLASGSINHAHVLQALLKPPVKRFGVGEQMLQCQEGGVCQLPRGASGDRCSYVWDSLGPCQRMLIYIPYNILYNKPIIENKVFSSCSSKLSNLRVSQVLGIPDL